VTESDVIILNLEESTPPEIVKVADSETLIIAAFEEVAMFSAAEKVADDVKDGAVVSADVYVKVKAMS
jgi:hypothetical protein